MKAIVVTGAAGVDPGILRAATERVAGAGVVIVHAKDEAEAAELLGAEAPLLSPDALDVLLRMPKTLNRDVVLRTALRDDVPLLDVPLWKRRQTHPTSPKRQRK